MKRTTETIPLASSLSTLSDTLRLRMLRVLEREELAVGEVAKIVQLPQSTVSRHLKTLADGGWLSRRSEGTATLYRVLLDDLDAGMRGLWITVRDAINREPSLELEADLRRLARVVEARRTDSRAFFGRVAAEWQSMRASLFGHSFTAPGLLALVDPSWVVADLGCGSGDATRHLAPHVKSVLAVDQSEAMLETAEGLLATLGNVEFICGDLEAVPLPESSADAAVISLVLHHVAAPAAVLTEAARILRPDRGGGRVVVIDMLAHDREEYRRTMGHVHLGFDPETIDALLRESGFVGTHVHELPTQTDSRGPGLFVASARVPDSH
ncbi:MAG: metalloregulator ArsR/SmtB family transcription factor [Planctomycetota bacterium]